MIGNDVIDLNLAAIQSDPLRKGYLSKIFTHQEQKLIEEAENPVFQVWVLWAIKEAGYKAHQRRFDLQRWFRPQDLECQIFYPSSSLVKANVTVNSFKYLSEVTLTKSYLHASASHFPQEKLISVFFNENSSAQLKEELITTFSHKTDLPRQELSIRKNLEQVPFLYYREQRLNHAFSLSHHGNYSGFILSLTNY